MELLEAVFTELQKEVYRDLGHSINNSNLSPQKNVGISLKAMPFYAAATTGIGGVLSLYLKPSGGNDRYDLYVCSTIASASTDGIKGLLNAITLTGCEGVSVRDLSGFKKPRSHLILKIPTRLMMVAARNCLFDAINHTSGSELTAAVVSQAFYALSNLREPLHRMLENTASTLTTPAHSLTMNDAHLFVTSP